MVTVQICFSVQLDGATAGLAWVPNVPIGAGLKNEYIKIFKIQSKKTSKSYQLSVFRFLTIKTSTFFLFLGFWQKTEGKVIES